MRTLVLVALLFAPSGTGFADDIIHGHYCYTYGDRESLQEARELARSLAIRNAIESYRAFITSTSTVSNFQLTNDLVQIISSGYLKDIKSIGHKEEGRMVCETIQASVSAQALENIIKEAKERVGKSEEIGLANNGCIKILSYKKGSDRWYEDERQFVNIMAKVLKRTGALHTNTIRNLNPCFKICVDFYDKDSNPMPGLSKFIHESSLELVPGEIRSIEFPIPFGAVSWRVWLPNEK